MGDSAAVAVLAGADVLSGIAGDAADLRGIKVEVIRAERVIAERDGAAGGVRLGREGHNEVSTDVVANQELVRARIDVQLGSHGIEHPRQGVLSPIQQTGVAVQVRDAGHKLSNVKVHRIRGGHVVEGEGVHHQGAVNHSTSGAGGSAGQVVLGSTNISGECLGHVHGDNQEVGGGGHGRPGVLGEAGGVGEQGHGGHIHSRGGVGDLSDGVADVVSQPSGALEVSSDGTVSVDSRQDVRSGGGSHQATGEVVCR
mmetsp:Transcript_99009/g.137489  ORF Transcript_99009/g.137489 Transcript_99009/m.137489 type:complete len:255 (+) Transcript_99009:1989-2753(+)